jgi:copper/silver efflux system protein
MLNRAIKYFLENRLISILIVTVLVMWGLVTSPFEWNVPLLPSDPVAVDAIPDIGENQQIVFTQWMGRSPQDIDDQITYPLTTSLLGIPGVKSIRSSSIFGVSSIYLIFEEDVEFYWSRSRILEKLNSLPRGLLPENVQPSLGPDATALGQVCWYTLEGRDKDGNPTGGWDLHEIRTAQDYYVKYGLNAVDGVSEVASIGGHVQEYQIDVNPDALKVYDIPLHKVMMAVKQSNKDVGAKTIEINRAEYLVRGLGYVKSIEDLEKAVVAVHDNVPIRIKDIAVVNLGPATRRGMLDKDGAEVVGGVVVARYGSNPLQVINNVKDKINELAPGLPKKTLSNGVESQLTIVPFYDRTVLIKETLGTLEHDLTLELIITTIIIIVAMGNIRSALVISSLLPIAILVSFILMRYLGVDANIVALTGIAIAIGEMIDLGIVLIENIVKHKEQAPEDKPLIQVVYEGASEVGSALLTAVGTTLVSFTPVFLLESAEGKLFGPLAYTKTFAMASSAMLALFLLPTLFYMVSGITIKAKKWKLVSSSCLALGGFVLLFISPSVFAFTAMFLGVLNFLLHMEIGLPKWMSKGNQAMIVIAVAWFFSQAWLPLGPDKNAFSNFAFTSIWLIVILGGMQLVQYYYANILGWCLANKKIFLMIPSFMILTGITIWLGFSSLFGFIALGFDKVDVNIRTTAIWSGMNHTFPGIGKEFMPSLDEGSFLLMPTSMPHAGFQQNKQVVQQLDMILANIPEVDLTVGKMGRVESALDPAPISMYENIINYKSEFLVNEKGHRVRFKVDDQNRFILQSGNVITNEEALLQGIESKDLLPDKKGRFFRNWRMHIKNPDDIWNEIIKVANIPGVTSAPKLQPIETRLVMLQTGMRAPMGIKVYGPDLKTIEDFGMKLEGILKAVPSVKSEAVFADRIVGKPYIHLNIDRDAIGRYGLSVDQVQQTIEMAIGGMKVGSTVEGRERFPIRIRYPRELRDDPEALKKVYISTPVGVQVPLGDLVKLEYVRGPQMIKSENTFLVGYVLLDKKDGYAEVDVVEESDRFIQEKIESGELIVPAGVSYKFSGSYENQIRAEKKFMIVIPLTILVIFLILYFEFKVVATTLFIFSGIFVSFSGGFIFMWLYGMDWFGNFDIMGTNLRGLFQMKSINLSVAVWVGFISLFGIATDDGVIITSYMEQLFKKHKPETIEEVRATVLKAGKKRIRPALMTICTTLIALLPVLTSSGRGSDIALPMAIPTYGGMLIGIITVFIVPTLYCWRAEVLVKKAQNKINN